jgi:hypothetical protein
VSFSMSHVVDYEGIQGQHRRQITDICSMSAFLCRNKSNKDKNGK